MSKPQPGGRERAIFGSVFSSGDVAPAPRAWRHAFAFRGLLLAMLLAILAGGPTVGFAADSQAPLDLNLATAEQLEALPGIGEVKAAAILAVREERGGFGSLDDLESVRGIGPSLAERLRPLLKIDPKTRSARK